MARQLALIPCAGNLPGVLTTTPAIDYNASLFFLSPARTPTNNRTCRRQKTRFIHDGPTRSLGCRASIFCAPAAVILTADTTKSSTTLSRIGTRKRKSTALCRRPRASAEWNGCRTPQKWRRKRKESAPGAWRKCKSGEMEKTQAVERAMFLSPPNSSCAPCCIPCSFCLTSRLGVG